MKLPKHILNKMSSYSEFSRRVWTECAKIPRGTTVTYAEIAKRIGAPRAARAVGTALSKNPFAPIVPCHRVIRHDGKPGGYSAPGGTAAKIRLLQSEQK